MVELGEGFCLLTHFQQYIPFTKEALHEQNSAISTPWFEDINILHPFIKKHLSYITGD